MATLEDELKDLKEKNNELAQKVQYWKMTAAQKDDEKLELMKEINELRLKLSRLRNNGGFQVRKLDTALQDASEKALSNLVKASAEIAKSMEIAKAYMRDWQELDVQSPRWSSIGESPKVKKSERIHRVPPMMMGGQSIQPVVALSRTLLNTSNPRSTTRSPNRSLTERAVPMHMLQDVYIPLTRINMSDLPNNNIEMEVEADIEVNNAVHSPEEFVQRRLGGNYMDDDDSLGSDDRISEGEEYDGSKLEPVSEEDTTMNVSATEMEPVSLRLQIGPREDRWRRPDAPRDKPPGPPQDKQPTLPGGDRSFENPLEGPSWLLDDTPAGSATSANCKGSARKSGRYLVPDSTTAVVRNSDTSYRKSAENTEAESSPSMARAFSPTVRRRKRTSSPRASPRPPPYSPRPNSTRRISTNGRVLKVLVAKMRLDESPTSSPPKTARLSRSVFDAPSPNGATDSRVIVSESRTSLDNEIAEQCARSALRDSIESYARANSLERETQPSSARRFSHEHDDSRTVASVHERRYNNLDGHDSHHRGRLTSQDRCDSGQSSRQRSRLDSHDSRDSDSGSGGGGDSVNEGRTRRVRKAMSYKEKPLNRKLRR